MGIIHSNEPFYFFLMGRPESTVRNYNTRYKTTGHFEEKRGRLPISQEKNKKLSVILKNRQREHYMKL